MPGQETVNPRTIQHTSQRRLSVNSSPDAINLTPNGEPTLMYRSDGGLYWVVKHNGVIHNLKFQPGPIRDRNDYVEGSLQVNRGLITNDLQYKRKFIDYRYIIHNFSRDIGTDEIYIPWFGVGENVSMDYVSSAMLAPFKMTLYKFYIRPATLTGATADLALSLDKQDDGDVTVDSIATFTYTTTLASNTLITINQSDWSADPVVEAGDKVGISIDASIDPSGTIIWYITSVWKVEVTV